MRSRTPRTLEGHCVKCYLRQNHCLCASLPKVDNSVEVVIVRHVAESYLTSNTGRLTELCLSNCRILPYGGGAEFDETLLAEPCNLLLYPGTSSSATFVPKRLIVLDATFRQAKRMYHRIESLRTLPQLSLPAPVIAPHRLRKPTHPDGMSTIEAVAEGLAQVESVEAKTLLLEAYAKFVERSDYQRGRIRIANASDESLSLPHLGHHD